MTYALPTNITHFAELYVWANNTTGFSTIGILVFLFAIAFVGTQKYGAALENSILVSLVACTMVSGAFMIMGALNGTVVSVLLILTALSYIYTYHA